MLFVGLLVLLKDLLILLFMKLFSLDAEFSLSVFINFVSSSIFTGFITPFIFYIFNYMDSRYIEPYSSGV